MNNFDVKNKFGEDRIGEIYLANDMNLGITVALKVINPLLTSDPQFVKRLEQEARILNSIIHSNIVQLYKFFIYQDKFIMVLEYAEGITLKQLISQIGPIPEERAMRIFKQLCDGLTYAHNKGVIHRNINPSNIMIDEKDNIKIMGFGIAELMGDEGLIRTGAKIEKLYYMSPEQINAEEGIDQRSDIYSMAIMLFEMLSGKLPFDISTKSDFILMNSIVNVNLPDLRVNFPSISDETVRGCCIVNYIFSRNLFKKRHKINVNIS